MTINEHDITDVFESQPPAVDAPKPEIAQAALEFYDAGLCPIQARVDGSKAPLGKWKQYQTERPSREQVWQQFQNHTGLGIVCGAISQNVECLDFDDRLVYLRFCDQAQKCGLGPLLDRIREGYEEFSPNGAHLLYRVAWNGKPDGNTKLASITVEDRPKTIIETRAEGGFIILAPSHGGVHPSGKPYELQQGGPSTIVTITEDERQDLFQAAQSFGTCPEDAVVEPQPVSANGEERPGDIFARETDWPSILRPHEWVQVSDNGTSQAWRRPGKDVGISATTNHNGSGYLYVFSTSTLFDPGRGYGKFSAYAFLNHGGDFKAAAKSLAGEPAGLTRLRLSGGGADTTVGTPPWPALDQAALHGLAGEIVQTIDPYTEADLTALLVNILTMFGSVVGPSPHFLVERTKHHLRLFVCLVGQTSKGRKGQSFSTPRYLFQQVDPSWADNRIAAGLSSGEGLIYQVRDQKNGVNKQGETVIEDAGEPDKRFLLVEEELSGPLKTMSREGNTLSAILRQAWDRGDLRPLTKTHPIRATGAHISLIGHITQAELLRHLTETEQSNGFGNRFCWFLVKRSKLIPRPKAVPDEKLNPLVQRLSEAVTHARQTTEIDRDEAAEELWAEVYPDLSEGRPGLFGAMIGRAEAQTMRLACLYALLDRSAIISREHLEAGLALWEYAEQSARSIFGDARGDAMADEILLALRNSPGGLTRTEVRDVFGRHKNTDAITAALTSLGAAGSARQESAQTAGRPTERWFAT